MAWPKDKTQQASKNRGTLGPFTAGTSGKGGVNSANLKKPDVSTPAERPRPWVAGFSQGAPRSDYGKGGN